MPPVLIQKKETEKSTAEGTVTATYDSPVTAGNLLFIVLRLGLDLDIPITVADNVNAGNWSQAFVRTNDNNRILCVCYKENTAAGTPTVTVTLSNATDASFKGSDIFEYSGIVTTAALDQQISVAVLTPTTTPNSGNIITTNADDLLIGVITFDTDSTTTISAEATGFTQQENDTIGTSSHCHLHVADRIVSAAGTYNYQPTLNNAETAVVGIVAFKAATGGNISISPAPATIVTSKVDPPTILGSLLLSVAVATVVATSFGCVLAFAQTPGISTVRADAVSPTVVQSSISITPGIATVVVPKVDPTVVTVGGTLFIPSPASVVVGTVDPTTIGGALILSPAAASVVVVAADPTIRLGSISLIPVPVFCVVESSATLQLAGVLTLAWDASVGAAGYKIYYDVDTGAPYTGTGAIEGASPINVGNVLIYSIHGLVGTYYFALTAYNSLGQESGYSSEFVATINSGFFITPAVADMIVSRVDPAVILGSITVAPTARTVVAAKNEPAVLIAGNIDVTPAAAFATTQIVNPTVQLSSLIIAPAARTVVVTKIEPTVELVGGFAITPVPASMVVSKVDPAIIHGSIAIGPPSALLLVGILNPTVIISSDIVIPAPATVVTGILNPTILFSGVVVTPVPANCYVTTMNPNAVGGLPSFPAAIGQSRGWTYFQEIDNASNIH